MVSLIGCRATKSREWVYTSQHLGVRRDDERGNLPGCNAISKHTSVRPQRGFSLLISYPVHSCGQVVLFHKRHYAGIIDYVFQPLKQLSNLQKEAIRRNRTILTRLARHQNILTSRNPEDMTPQRLVTTHISHYMHTPRKHNDHC